MQKEVITVQGKVDPESLGIVDAHSHLWISPLDLPAGSAPVLNQEGMIRQELVSYRQSGGGAQVDCQPGGAGRDANRLRQLSLESDVAVIASTGFHLKRYYPEGSLIWEMDSEEAAVYFRSEINQGLKETRDGKIVYPGLIKIAVEETLELSPRPLLEAAVQLSRETGLAIEMHTEKGADLENILGFLHSNQLASDRLVICHIDKRPDLGLHKELARSGYMLEYDTFFRDKYDPEKNLWPLIHGMVAAGLSDAIALATDQADPEMWESSGKGPGLPGFITRIKKRLDDEIRDPALVKKLVGGNISRRIAVLKETSL